MPRTHLLEERLTHSIIGAFFEVYNYFGYGLLEAAYVGALERELRRRGIRVHREHWVPVTYKGDEICLQRLDMVVEGRVVIETKATPVLAPIATRQLLSYLRASKLQVGLLLHFGPEPQFYRVVNTYDRARRA